MLTEIVNHVWQSTFTAAALASLAALLRNDGAHVRYWLWWAASVKFLVPFSLLVMVGSSLARTRTPLFEVTAWPTSLGLLAKPMPDAAAWNPLAAVLVGVWAIGLVTVIATSVARAHKARALVHASVPCTAPTLPGGLETRMSAARVEPALVGLLRPVLLLPQGIAARLTPAQLDAVLAHELAHWRRRDNLTAAVHMLVQAAFWFHPLVWWIGRRLVEERERACDEAVLRAGHDGRVYADGILNVCEHYVASRLECAAGVSGADLKRRVVEIARNRVMKNLTIEKKALLAAAALSLSIVPVIFGAVSGRAGAQDANNDKDVIPIERFPPDYPPEALAAHLDGEAELEFTVAVDGTTKDIVVVSSSLPEFGAAAAAALAKWRYNPRIENGRRVERRGVYTIIRFQYSRD